MSREKLLRRLRKRFTAGCFHIFGIHTLQLFPLLRSEYVWKGLPLLPLFFPSYFFTSCSFMYTWHVQSFLQFFNHIFHNLASTCSPQSTWLLFTFISSFPSLAPSFSPSRSLHLSQQTFSDSLSCELGCLSSLISKHVSLSLSAYSICQFNPHSAWTRPAHCVSRIKAAVHISELNGII